MKSINQLNSKPNNRYTINFYTPHNSYFSKYLCVHEYHRRLANGSLKQLRYESLPSDIMLLRWKQPSIMQSSLIRLRNSLSLSLLLTLISNRELFHPNACESENMPSPEIGNDAFERGYIAS